MMYTVTPTIIPKPSLSTTETNNINTKLIRTTCPSQTLIHSFKHKRNVYKLSDSNITAMMNALQYC